MLELVQAMWERQLWFLVMTLDGVKQKIPSFQSAAQAVMEILNHFRETDELWAETYRRLTSQAYQRVIDLNRKEAWGAIWRTARSFQNMDVLSVRGFRVAHALDLAHQAAAYEAIADQKDLLHNPAFFLLIFNYFGAVDFSLARIKDEDREEECINVHCALATTGDPCLACLSFGPTFTDQEVKYIHGLEASCHHLMIPVRRRVLQENSLPSLTSLLKSPQQASVFAFVCFHFDFLTQGGLPVPPLRWNAIDTLGSPMRITSSRLH